MFVEKFTQKEIELYRSLMPLKINGTNVNYSIYCNGHFYNPTKNRLNSCLFIKDFACTLSYMDNTQKIKLNELHQDVMSKIFKDEYILELNKLNNNNDLSL